MTSNLPETSSGSAPDGLEEVVVSLVTTYDGNDMDKIRADTAEARAKLEEWLQAKNTEFDIRPPPGTLAAFYVVKASRSIVQELLDKSRRPSFVQDADLRFRFYPAGEWQVAPVEDLFAVEEGGPNLAPMDNYRVEPLEEDEDL